MKETRFIELLNLYVDQEITPAEARELEAEILRSPDRRRVYGQYCRMQRACVSLFETENRQAPPVQMAKLLAAARTVEEKVTAFPGPSTFEPNEPARPVTWWPRLAWGAGLAACLALTLTVGWRQLGPSTAPLAVPSLAPEINHAAVSGSAVQVPTLASEPVAPVMLRRSDTLAAAPSTYPQFISTWRSLPQATLASVEDAAEVPSLEWMRGLEFAPIQRAMPDQLRFESRTAFPAGSEPRTFRGRAADGFQTEMSAFQFQR